MSKPLEEMAWEVRGEILGMVGVEPSSVQAEVILKALRSSEKRGLLKAAEIAERITGIPEGKGGKWTVAAAIRAEAEKLEKPNAKST